MELNDYLKMLRAHWVAFIVCGILGLAAAAAYSYNQPKVYAANANGFVTSGSAENSALASVSDSLAKSRAKSYIEVATSRQTAQAVIDDLGLDTTAAGLIGRISVVQPDDTVLLKITAQAPSPAEAQQLADAWVAALAAQVAHIEGGDGKDRPADGLRIEVVESAALPSAPISPRVERNMALGMVLGLLIGFGYAVARSILDRRLRSIEDVEKQFGVSVIGAIPESKPLTDSTGKAVLAVDDAGRGAGSSAAEAFRKVRTNLSFMDIDNPPRVLVITSPKQSDGKSTVAANVAAAIAVTGQRVTLIDGDLRRPTVADSFGLVEGAGLTDVLIGRVDLADVVQQHPHHEALSILAAGGIPPNPSELLGSQTMRHLLELLAQDGMVIIDAPPLLPVTDAAVLTRNADGAIVVISTGKTLDRELADSLAALDAVHGRVLGIIFNRVSKRNAAGGYYAGYYEQYGDAPAATSTTVHAKSVGGRRAHRA